MTVSQGGELRVMAEEWGVPHLSIADGIPMPRAGIGAVSIPPLLVLEQVGLFPGASSWIDAAVAQLDEAARRAGDRMRTRPRIWLGASDAQMPIVYGGGGSGSVAALRWKNQFNENAKVPSFWNQTPRALPQRAVRMGSAR